MSGSGAVDGELASMLSCCTMSRLWAEQDEGPYHRSGQPARRDIVEDREGVALQLGIRLSNADGTPVVGCDMQIWQCDAHGNYSGFPPPDARNANYLSDQTFLRGHQITDAAGMVEFRTIYPGWYPGRAVHIHLMVHTPARTYTSQLYFPEEITAAVLADGVYRAHGLPDTTHATDGIFATGGQPAVLEIRPDIRGHVGLLCLLLPHEMTA